MSTLNRNHQILLGILLICFTGCNTQPKTATTQDWVYHIDKNESYETKALNLHDIATVDYIKLETTPDCLMDETAYLRHIQLTDNYIFILNSGVVFRFDRDGKFLNKIDRRGNGPEEYIAAFSVVIDDTQKEVLFYDQATYNLLKYSYNGKFINSINMGAYISQMALLGGDTLACYSGYSETDPAYTLRSSSDGKIIKTFSGIDRKSVV